MSKEAFNIDGLGKKVIDQFWQMKLIREPSDIFKLDFKKIESLEGWGELSISNLKEAIKKSKTITLDKFIFSIGIRHIGQENAKILAGFFGSIKEFTELLKSKVRKKILINLVDLDGIGETQIQSIDNFFLNNTNTKITEELIKQLNIQDFNLKNSDGKFSNKKVYVYRRISKYEPIRGKSYSRIKWRKSFRSNFKKTSLFSSWRFKAYKKKN